jgi:hypothetical protein
VDGVFVLPSMQLVFGGVLCDEGMQKGGDQACQVSAKVQLLAEICILICVYFRIKLKIITLYFLPPTHILQNSEKLLAAINRKHEDSHMKCCYESIK